MNTTGTTSRRKPPTGAPAGTREARMVRIVRVAGESMAPTYRSSDLLLTRPVGRASGIPSRGTAIVFHRDGRRLVKRAVAGPGDTVEMEAGRLFVNGASVDGRQRLHGAHTVTWLVPEASYFVVGDDAMASDDSRVWEQPFVSAKDVDATIARRLSLRRSSGGAHRAAR